MPGQARQPVSVVALHIDQPAALPMVAPVKWTVIMTVNKEQVLAALAKVPSPGGTALPDARVLSDVVVSEGKVFFSLTVDATAAEMRHA